MAILGSAELDVMLVNPASLALGGVGLAQRAGGGHPGPAYSLEDVNGDGVVDLVAFFGIPALVAAGVLTDTTTSLILTGTLVNARQIEAADTVTVVP